MQLSIPPSLAKYSRSSTRIGDDRDGTFLLQVQSMLVLVRSPLPSGRTASIFRPPSPVQRMTWPWPYSGGCVTFMPPW